MFETHFLTKPNFAAVKEDNEVEEEIKSLCFITEGIKNLTLGNKDAYKDSKTLSSARSNMLGSEYTTTTILNNNKGDQSKYSETNPRPPFSTPKTAGTVNMVNVRRQLF